jgi:hypothetical protein
MADASARPSKLLLPEDPLIVLPTLAQVIGLNEAIILQQIHYWLLSAPHEHDGRRWIYNSYPKWRQQFPFWSEDIIRRTINRLEQRGLLLSTSAYNRLTIDRTKWYTIDYDKLNALNIALPARRRKSRKKTDPIAVMGDMSQMAGTGTLDGAGPGGRGAGPARATHAPSGTAAGPAGVYAGPAGATHPPSGALAAAIPETTTKTTTEHTAKINNREGESREQENAPPPPPPTFENFTIDDALRAWWAEACRQAGIPLQTISLSGETGMWQDYIRAGRRRVPVDARADWCLWMLHAIRYEQRRGR